MTIQEFFSMGGHGFYIWSSYGISAIVFIGLYIGVRVQRKRLIQQLQRRYRHETRTQPKQPSADSSQSETLQSEKAQ
jgi:heme exporter protein D